MEFFINELKTNTGFVAILSVVITSIFTTITLVWTQKKETERLIINKELELEKYKSNILIQEKQIIYKKILEIISGLMLLLSHFVLVKEDDINQEEKASYLDRLYASNAELIEYFYANKIHFSQKTKKLINETINYWVLAMFKVAPTLYKSKNESRQSFITEKVLEISKIKGFSELSLMEIQNELGATEEKLIKTIQDEFGIKEK